LKTIQLPYGKSHIDFSLSEERLAGILAPTICKSKKRKKSQDEIVREALENPIGSQRLSDLSVGKQNIVLIASDHPGQCNSRRF